MIEGIGPRQIKNQKKAGKLKRKKLSFSSDIELKELSDELESLMKELDEEF
jgi:hypothetical protein